MLPSAHIPVGISTHNCLAWSPDGELALAAGEEVYLLLPCLSGTEPWSHVRIQVNAFTTSEWPCREPTSFKDMSIGEEQAQVTVTALAWSPCGLAKHRRSVLAVLTSNLLLSLWTSYSDPTDPESWERVMIINHYILPQNGPMPLPQSPYPQRIRSMAWVPTCSEHAEHQVTFSERKWGVFLMALTDDSNGVYFVTVTSPFLGAYMTWDLQILICKSFQPNRESNHRPSLLSLAMSERQFINYIEFGSWNSGKGIPVTYHSSRSVYQDMLGLVLGSPLSVTLNPLGIAIGQPRKDLMQPLRIMNALSPPPFSPSIDSQIQKQKDNYGAERGLGKYVLSKVWGSAFFCNLSAVCITLHPSQSIEYTIAAEDTAIVLFDSVNSVQDKFPWQDALDVDETRALQVILDAILDRTLLKSLDLSGLDFKIIYSAICASMLTADLRQPQLVQILGEILDLLESHTGVNMKAEHNTLKSIHTLPRNSHHKIVNLVRNTTALRGRASTYPGSSTMHLLEDCPICSTSQEPTAICFESFTEAYCSERHPFVRCALTFVPITEPGFSKHCTKCSREFLDERLHPAIRPYAANRDARASLASWLLEKFDVCPYCAGKFQD